MKKIKTFVDRLKKIGINIQLETNYPWVYLAKINNKTVKEKQSSDYGYTLCFLPVMIGKEIVFINTNETFKLLRKYI